MSNKRYNWFASGDVNAFFGLMLDNIAGLLLMVGLLNGVFEFPTKFAMRYMVPGTAIGVLVGDLLLFALAFKLARRTGRDTVTAMPLGLDTPSTFGMVFFVLGPAFLHAKTGLQLSELEAAKYAWRIGICSIFLSGILKLVCAGGANWIRSSMPRAGLLGSLAAIALVLISFLPLLEVLHSPIVGLTAFAVILTTLVARIPLPFHLPGAFGALLVGGVIHYAMLKVGWAHADANLVPPAEALWPYEWLSVFQFEWVAALKDTVPYLPVLIPFALATVVGGIDCTESAAAAGDEFDTREIIGVEALATLVAALCGGVIQTTPYIGHPAYKAMGGRAAYTLATAIFVGSAGLLGYFGYLYAVIPKPAVFPILIFIGLEITAQSFHATPKRHYAAVAIACLPALAALALIFLDKMLGELIPHGITAEKFSASMQNEITTVRMLASGFIVTSLLWASLLASLIDRKLRRAAAFALWAGIATLFGIIHSPLPGSPLFLPWQLSSEFRWIVIQFAAGYFAVALLLFAGQLFGKQLDETLAFDEH